jgi:hypothetical protein
MTEAAPQEWQALRCRRCRTLRRRRRRGRSLFTVAAAAALAAATRCTDIRSRFLMSSLAASTPAAERGGVDVRARRQRSSPPQPLLYICLAAVEEEPWYRQPVGAPSAPLPRPSLNQGSPLMQASSSPRVLPYRLAAHTHAAVHRRVAPLSHLRQRSRSRSASKHVEVTASGTD